MPSPNSDESLSRTLQEWRVAPPRDPRFRANIAARIAAENRPSTWSGFARVHPAIVSGALAAAVLVGAWTGLAEARQQTRAVRSALATNYVHALDARWMRHP